MLQSTFFILLGFLISVNASSCPAGQEYRFLTCASLPSCLGNCYQPCTMVLKPGCTCKPGYVPCSNSTCIPQPSRCPSTPGVNTESPTTPGVNTESPTTPRVDTESPTTPRVDTESPTTTARITPTVTSPPVTTTKKPDEIPPITNSPSRPTENPSPITPPVTTQPPPVITTIPTTTSSSEPPVSSSTTPSSNPDVTPSTTSAPPRTTEPAPATGTISQRSTPPNIHNQSTEQPIITPPTDVTPKPSTPDDVTTKNTPSTPSSTTPSTPSSTTQSTPSSTTQSTPSSTTPSTPSPTTPSTPSSATPSAPSSTTKSPITPATSTEIPKKSKCCVLIVKLQNCSLPGFNLTSENSFEVGDECCDSLNEGFVTDALKKCGGEKKTESKVSNEPDFTNFITNLHTESKREGNLPASAFKSFNRQLSQSNSAFKKLSSPELMKFISVVKDV
ncbi:mucin-2-like [Diachasmimorpha longicaudata]|uniref:mucin-2-like n=1 Tax=Diachasmimorpha longicaudata TaxID=58733 RepID=UPI0030B90D52